MEVQPLAAHNYSYLAFFGIGIILSWHSILTPKTSDNITLSLVSVLQAVK